MPPRRSSRSKEASIELEPAPQTKRKRGSTVNPELKQKGKTTEPSTRRRSTSTRLNTAAPTTRRVSSRSNAPSPDVPESEGDGETEPAPPIKKARPSIEPKSEGSDLEERDSKALRPRSSLAKRDRSVTSSRKQTAASKRSGRSTRAMSTPASEIRNESKDNIAVKQAEEDEDSDRPRENDSQVSTVQVGALNRQATTEDSDVSMYNPEGGDVSKLRSWKGKTNGATLAESHKSLRKSVAASGFNLEQEKPPGATKRDTLLEVITTHEERFEEEERSLFDPPPVPPSSQSVVIPEEPSGPKPRLVIYKMALVNFKSYAGRQEIGPFHKSFSSIVGPNGSGKSNTIDALLFVFGYRASKMRQGKLSELIHNSARYPDFGECSVEVHFREIIDLPGPDDFEVVTGSLLVVTRQAFKNNSSKYTINEKPSTYTEVQSLLKGRGIDLDHNRFLILQGEVESIAQMKPKAASEHEDGLLEYLEDIIGTSRFKEPIDVALVEMERLQEERQVKLNRLRLVEKEKSALEAKKKEAEDYLRLKNEHVRAQSRLWQWIIWKCFDNDDKYKEAIVKLKQELENERNNNKDDILHLEQLQEHFKARQAAYAEVQAAAAEALKELAAHEKEEVGLQERRKHAAGKAKKLKKSLQEDMSSKAKAIRDIQENADKIIREKEKADRYEAELVTEEKVLENIRDSLKDKTQVFHDQIEVKQKELQPWTNKINKKQAEIDVASSERDALAKKAEALEAARKCAQEDWESLKSDHVVKTQEYEKLQNSKVNIDREIQLAIKTAQDRQKNIQEWRGKAGSSRQKADEAKASQADNRSQNRVLESLTRLQATGRIAGFHGRLGALGTIPDKYDIAISTAAPALHHMVVDLVNQGQACIEYLRAQNVGRASFMVLEKLGQSSGMDKISTPENVPRLFDLIKPKDSRFAPAFYKAVGNTLVAENMDQANRIAFGGTKRWKIVTLNGQLIETSGTMSGGGTQLARGAMSSKLAADTVSPQVLRMYEQESDQAAQMLEQAMNQSREAEERLEVLRNSGPQMDIALQKLAMDIENSKRRIADAQRHMQEVNAQDKPNKGDMNRISTLNNEIATSEAELLHLQEKSGTIEAGIQALEKKILDIGGSQLLKQKSTVDGIKLHINLANDEITKAEVARAKAQKDIVKFDAVIETNTAALQEAENELGDLEGHLEGLTAYVTELRAKVEDAQEAAENSKGDLYKLKAKLEKKEKEIEKFRQKEMDIQQRLDDTQKEADENEKLIDHWRVEHDKLELEDIDDNDDGDDEDDGDNIQATSNPPESAQKAEPGGSNSEIKADPDKPPHQLKVKVSSMELYVYRPEELTRFKKRELVADVELLDENLKNSKPDLSVLKEYRRREEEFMNRAKDLEQITAERDAQKAEYDGLRKQRLDEFMAGFNLISLKLKEMYQMITLGGNAELELVDSMDPFSEGIIFSVMPPKKSWKNISNLSGGEKTLSSLALVFALHVFKPTPLYFMDEIDAALDFRNVSIVANYIKDRTKNAQFIIISLRNDMFELSHRLIGIYKTANATRSISIDNHALTVPLYRA